MVKYKVIDNFLSEKDFIQLRNFVSPNIDDNSDSQREELSWKYTQDTVDENLVEKLSYLKSPSFFDKVTDIEPARTINSWVLSHILWEESQSSPALPIFGKLLDKINPIAIWRIHATLTPQQEKRMRGAFHIDYGHEPLEHNSLITSIFYMNTTNGPTILEDCTEIESRANRLLSFPYDTYHAAVSCTDSPYRIIVNLNYFGNRYTYLEGALG